MLLIAVAAAAGAAWWLRSPMPVRAGLGANQPLELEIEPGTTPRGVAQAVVQAGFDTDARLLYWWFRLSGKDRGIKAGNYEVPPGRENGVLDFDAGASTDRAGTNPYLSEQFLQDIAAATTQASIVIPYFHFGEEYAGIVPVWAANGARAAIDAGATMVVTNHPHVVQGMEIYNGRPIVYSPGNFILDQMWGVEVRSSHALEIGFRGTDIVRIRCHGIEIEDFNQPRPMTAGEQANLMDRFWTSTDRLAARDG